MSRCGAVVACPAWRSRALACPPQPPLTHRSIAVGGQLAIRVEVWTNASGETTQSDDFLAEPDEALALLFSEDVLVALSPLGLPSLLPEPESLAFVDDDSELADLDEESESDELLDVLADERLADPVRESLL